MTEAIRERNLSFGISAMIAATLALFISVAHMSMGPFEKHPPVEQTIAETAVKIKEAAKRAVSGKPAPPVQTEESRFNLDVFTQLVALAIAGIAMLLGITALFRREKQQGPAYVGFSLGAGVLLVFWLQWIALMLCGAIVLAAIIYIAGPILPS